MLWIILFQKVAYAMGVKPSHWVCTVAYEDVSSVIVPAPAPRLSLAPNAPPSEWISSSFRFTQTDLRLPTQ